MSFSSHFLPVFFTFFLPFQITIRKPVQKMRAELKIVTDFVASPCAAMRKGIQLRRTSVCPPSTELRLALLTAVTRCWLRGTQPAKPPVLCSCSIEVLPQCGTSLIWLCHFIREGSTKTNTEFLSCVIHDKCSQCFVYWQPGFVSVLSAQLLWAAEASEGGLVNPTALKLTLCDHPCLCIIFFNIFMGSRELICSEHEYLEPLGVAQ